jgi:hypothetical protein
LPPAQSAFVQHLVYGMHAAPQTLYPPLQVIEHEPPSPEQRFEPFATPEQLFGLLQQEPPAMQVPPQSYCPPVHTQVPPGPVQLLPPEQLFGA